MFYFSNVRRSFSFWAACPCSLHRFKQLVIQFTHTLGRAGCEKQDGWGKRSWEKCFLDLVSSVNVEFTFYEVLCHGLLWQDDSAGKLSQTHEGVLETA